MIHGISKEEEALIKDALLTSYAEQEVSQLIGCDGFTGNTSPVSKFADPDGDSLLLRQTKELVSGPFNVRVLIRDFTDPDVAVRLLRKIADGIEDRGSLYPEIHNGIYWPAVITADAEER